MIKKILGKHNLVSDVIVASVILLSALCLVTAEFYSANTPGNMALAYKYLSIAAGLTISFVMFFAYFLVRIFAKKAKLQELLETVFLSVGTLAFIINNIVYFASTGSKGDSIYALQKHIPVNVFAVIMFVLLALVLIANIVLRIYQFLQMNKNNSFASDNAQEDKAKRNVTASTYISFMVLAIASIAAISTVTKSQEMLMNAGMDAMSALKGFYLAIFVICFVWLTIQHIRFIKAKISDNLKAILDIVISAIVLVLFISASVADEYAPGVLIAYIILALACVITILVFACKVLSRSARAKAEKAQKEEIETLGVENVSYFDGKLHQQIGWNILCSIVNLFTLFIAMPATICWKQRWLAKHTVINGKRLVFDGKGMQLFGNYIKWWLLSIITIGIYTLWMPIKIEQWKSKHTRFEDAEDNTDCYFDGKLLQMIGWNWACALVNIFTLGIMYPKTICWKQGWFAKHRVVSGKRLMFDGKGMQLFGKWMLWLFLSLITCGIFAFWLPIKIEKWRVKHTKINKPEVEAEQSVQ